MKKLQFGPVLKIYELTGLDGIHFGFGARDKETAGSIQDILTLEIEICPIHHREGTGFWNEQIQNIDIVQLAI